jgi:RNA 3'-phosphate cyclase
MIYIDGAYMEGGGQIVRTALALSTLTGKPFTAEKIRHNRPKPGLRPQHLGCIEALRQLALAEVAGAQPGSAKIIFRPRAVACDKLTLDIGTAGSITLLLQSLLLPCMFADDTIRLEIKGGTDTKWSIPVDYFANVLIPFFNENASVMMSIIQRGFYPKGQGRVDLTITPRLRLSHYDKLASFVGHLKIKFSRIDLTSQPELDRIEGISAASIQLKGNRVAERQAEGASRLLAGLCSVKIEEQYSRTASVGTVITLWAISKQGKVFMGADALGEKGKRAEEVGATAAGKLLNLLKSDAAVDSHLADNIIPLLALRGGTIKTESITEHIRSNIYVCEKFLNVRFQIDEAENKLRVD